MEARMDVATERRILGGLLADSRLLDKVPDIMPEHWSDYRHREIFDAMRKLSHSHSPVDIKLVIEYLGIRKMVDWPRYVQELLRAATHSRVPIEALLLRVERS